MREAAASPSLAPENTAFALSLVGHLERLDGDPDAARAAFERALALVPDHAPSLAGLGRLAVGDGDLEAARGHFERAAAIVPLPEYVIALGETPGRGRPTPARGASSTWPAPRSRFSRRTAWPSTSTSRSSRPTMATRRRRSDSPKPRYDAAPTVRAADALAWGLHRAGRDDEALVRATEALRLGSRDPLFLYHAGAIAAALGDSRRRPRASRAALADRPGLFCDRRRRRPTAARRLGALNARSGPDSSDRPDRASTAGWNTVRSRPPESRQSPKPAVRWGGRSQPQSHRRFVVSTRSRVAAFGGALFLAISSATGAFASSHREAPLIAGDPSADNTDLYAFVSPDDPSKLTIVANYIPLQQPAGGPNFHPFDPSVRYEIHIDNNGDAIDDVTYTIRFKTHQRPARTASRRSSTTTARSRRLTTRTGSRRRPTGPAHQGRRRTTLGWGMRTVPANIGPRSTPGLCRARRHGRPAAQERWQVLCRAARRCVLRRPRLDLRPRRPATVQLAPRHPAR